jgi:hypothetical protein
MTMKRVAVVLGIALLAVIALTVSCTLDPIVPPGGGGGRLRSITVNVPEAYVADLNRLVVDVMLGSEVKAAHEYTVIAPPFTFDYDGEFDLVVARGYGSSGSLLFTAKGSPDGSSEVSLTLNYVGVGSADHVVIFQDGLPWDSTALTDLLALEGITEGTGTDQYEIITSVAFAAFVLDPATDLLIIANDQSQDFYNAIAASNDAILAFINAGGTVFWEACDNGWGGGSIVDAGITMPGGVTLVLAFEDFNIIGVPDHPIFQGVTVEPLAGSSASHEYFTNLPADALVLMTGQESGEPTLITYSCGAGLVFMTGQPLEYHVANEEAMAVVLPGLVKMVLGRF